MPWNVDSVVSARETLGRLLDELAIADYLFGIEPGERGWEVRVECRCREGSHTTRFALEAGVLQQSERDPLARRRLRRFLRERLGDCTRTAQRKRTSAPPEDADDEHADLSTLGALSEYSSTAGGAQPSLPSSLSATPFPTHPMSHFDGPDPLLRELYWYALEEATQDPHRPAGDLAAAEEAAMHLVQKGRRRAKPR